MSSPIMIGTHKAGVGMSKIFPTMSFLGGPGGRRNPNQTETRTMLIQRQRKGGKTYL